MWVIFKVCWVCYNIASVSCLGFLAARHAGFSASQPGIEPTPQVLECEVPTTEWSPGKSPTLAVMRVKMIGHCAGDYFIFFPFIFISWRLITLQYCSGFCHTLTWISHGFTCVPHADPPSHLPLHPIPLGLPSASAPSPCLMHPTWAGDLFHPW